MNLEIELSELRKRKLMVATPMYGGNCHGMYAKSCADLAKLCQAYEIELKFFYLFNESLITRARNYCADEFMRSDYTHLMFIDSDIGFDPHDVLTLLALMDTEEENPKEIMCGPYPKKTIAWEKIKRAVDKGLADDNPNDLEKYVGDYVFNPTDDTTEIDIHEPCSVLEGGTGFMMIGRTAFEKFDVAYPEYSYIPDHVRTEHFDGSREIMMYFQALIDPKSKRYLSEDYMFCQWMRDVDVNVYLCPWMKLQHTGSYTFGGSLSDIATLGASATADIDAIGKKRK
jgi:hypothetical protein